jgi:hypothetical protein
MMTLPCLSLLLLCSSEMNIDQKFDQASVIDLSASLLPVLPPLRSSSISDSASRSSSDNSSDDGSNNDSHSNIHSHRHSFTQADTAALYQHVLHFCESYPRGERQLPDILLMQGISPS